MTASPFPCPYCCLETECRILDSRPESYGRRRRRECAKCRNRFTTTEKAGVEFINKSKDKRITAWRQWFGELTAISE